MPYRKILIIALLLTILLSINALAQIELKAKVDKTSITIDEEIAYKLIITSQTLENIPSPEFPQFEGFVVLSSAQTSEISLARGELRTLVVYVFILQPKETGILVIEPSSVVVEQKTYSSQPLEIQVKQGKRRPPAQPESPLEEEIQSETEQIIL